jgi:hypothetical protein
MSAALAKSTNPFRYFDSSPEVIRLVVMMYVRYPPSLRNSEDLLFERGIDICHETVRLWWNRFGPMFAGEIRRKQVDRRRQRKRQADPLVSVSRSSGRRKRRAQGAEGGNQPSKDRQWVCNHTRRVWADSARARFRGGDMRGYHDHC